MQYRFFRRKTGFCKCFLQFVFEALVILTLKRSVYSNKHLKHVTSILQHFYLQIVRCSQKESSAHLGLLYIYMFMPALQTQIGWTKHQTTVLTTGPPLLVFTKAHPTIDIRTINPFRRLVRNQKYLSFCGPWFQTFRIPSLYAMMIICWSIFV